MSDSLTSLEDYENFRRRIKQRENAELEAVYAERELTHKAESMRLVRAYAELVQFMGAELRARDTPFGCTYDHNVAFHSILKRLMPETMADIECLAHPDDHVDAVRDDIAQYRNAEFGVAYAQLLILIKRCTGMVASKTEFTGRLKTALPLVYADFEFVRELLNYVDGVGFQWKACEFTGLKGTLVVNGPKHLCLCDLMTFKKMVEKQQLSDHVVAQLRFDNAVQRAPESHGGAVPSYPPLFEDFVPPSWATDPLHNMAQMAFVQTGQ